MSSAAPSPPPGRRSLGAVVACAAICALATLALRWWGPIQDDSTRFDPRPDGLEYAAGAQSIARDGRYLLHVGPVALRPRYAPGWPMVLAGALELGVPPERLVRLVGAADALLVFALALGAGLGVRALARARAVDPESGAAIAAALLGAASASAVAAFYSSNALHALSLHSDPMAMVWAVVALAAWSALWIRGRPASGRSDTTLALVAGIAFGATCVTRPIEGILLSPVLALAPWLRQRPELRRLVVRSALFVAGVALPVALAGLLLERSESSAWRWSEYVLWSRWKIDDGRLWRASYFWSAPVELGRAAAWPGWRVAASAVTGIPSAFAFGPVWPGIAWLAAAIGLWRRHRAESEGPLRAAWLLLALWSAVHLVFFGGLVWATQRYLLAPGYAVTLIAGVVLGTLALDRRPAVRLLALLSALAIGLAAVQSYGELLRTYPQRPQGQALAKLEPRFRAWQRANAARRLESGTRFDPLEAQAMGWIDQESARAVEVWGPLPRTDHALRLRQLGLLGPDQIKAPERAPGRRRRL